MRRAVLCWEDGDQLAGASAMASPIASPIPLRYDTSSHTESDIRRRDTPLPQYEKTQSAPSFTLNLQEDKSNPGRFQLVVNIDPKHQIPPGDVSQRTPTLTKDATPLPSSVLYQTQKTSPPTSPVQDKHGWTDLNTLPSEFLQNVVPDWNVTFSRSDSTASTQSKTLADIKARIKRKGRGYVVRLLKGSSLDPGDVAEVDLGQSVGGGDGAPLELDASPLRAELDGGRVGDSVKMEDPSTGESVIGRPDVFEIGTSNEPGVERSPSALNSRTDHQPSYQTLASRVSTRSVVDESLSDAETLIPEVRSIGGRMDDDETDCEPFSRRSSLFPVRTNSASSIVKTPTRGLSVVGPVRRVEKSSRIRLKGNAELGRSGAHKSIKRHSPQNSVMFALPSKPVQDAHVGLRQRLRTASRNSEQQNLAPQENSTWQHTIRESVERKPGHSRRSSVDDVRLASKPKGKLRLQTNIARPASANTSPITRRKKSPRVYKSSSSSSSMASSPETQGRGQSSRWSEVDGPDELREALQKVLETAPQSIQRIGETSERSVPRIVKPDDELNVGEIPLPAELEIRPMIVSTKSSMMTFWGLALSALTEKLHDGFTVLRDSYGAEPRVPPGHVRVRWTCSCGDNLYDDFIERRPGAARLLEAYLNRPQAHVSSPSSRSSTATSMFSVFDTTSRASTLATPSSTYGGSSPWGRSDGTSKPTPPRLSTSSPFSVRIGSYAEESWLLTCANEGRFTPKIVHLDVNEARIRSDRDLALVLREHYDQINRRWLSWARLRSLTTIEFVQFEVHRNRFADIRAAPSMPPVSATSAAPVSPTNEKSQTPSHQPYNFEPIDLLPPVGSTYLLHLFKHPTDYDGELITYLRCPKRRQRLEFGMGWGINLVEGFLPQRVWAVAVVMGVGSAVFAILWTIKNGDIQGAFGVAGWVLGTTGLLMGAMQAWLD
ncbi:hypothetical protein P153DRAFT_390417 [Dothidotthia symphoricarpi CBS 119687]|uniref:Uncharacterized protein n=1 Tax=Dothidotthia symphoricarpi CBS 119687 TaxID=1392245 RepID=A0A6A5ZXW9_9PLEO|nr:uncharacterized protein P153DRAFT_390417 [Dothidotthia symphoricarpi CBS 119687]KAF2124379.1 hypothetical protein P153DRAFT_390417 [Dothidotthia symphoricarpi CBS 119687]